MVKIAAYQESTIDYPGKMGVIMFTSGCNFKCGFCHNSNLINKTNGEISQEKLLRDLSGKARAGWYRGVTISGGEPTIHPDLPEFISQLKEYGLAVKLDTNGTNPKMLERLLEERLVDYVAMDVKCPRNIYNDMAGVRVNLEDIETSMVIVSRFPDYEFRTTVIPIKNEWMSTPEISQIAQWISEKAGPESKYFLQKFVARDSNEGVGSSLSKEVLSKEFHETPEELLGEMQEVTRQYLPNTFVR